MASRLRRRSLDDPPPTLVASASATRMHLGRTGPKWAYARSNADVTTGPFTSAQEGDVGPVAMIKGPLPGMRDRPRGRQHGT